MYRKKDGAIKGHPKGTKNNMRSVEEKEQIILDCLNNNLPYAVVGRKYGLSGWMVNKWVNSYLKDGIEGLKSKTGKCGSGNPYSYLYNKKNLTEVEKLKLELAKKEVECERLKKGYSVKGVGRRKEYVTISKKNLK